MCGLSVKPELTGLLSDNSFFVALPFLISKAIFGLNLILTSAYLNKNFIILSLTMVQKVPTCRKFCKLKKIYFVLCCFIVLMLRWQLIWKKQHLVNFERHATFAAAILNSKYILQPKNCFSFRAIKLFYVINSINCFNQNWELNNGFSKAFYCRLRQ